MNKNNIRQIKKAKIATVIIAIAGIVTIGCIFIFKNASEGKKSFDNDTCRIASETVSSNWGYSRVKLIETLESYGNSKESAIYAADHCNADWFLEAYEYAKYLESNYVHIVLDDSGVSENLPYETLYSECIEAGFTPEEADYGAKHASAAE